MYNSSIVVNRAFYIRFEFIYFIHFAQPIPFLSWRNFGFMICFQRRRRGIGVSRHGEANPNPNPTGTCNYSCATSDDGGDLTIMIGPLPDAAAA